MSWINAGRRPERRSSAGVDAFFDSYVRWRQACEDARKAYEHWRTSEPPGRRLAFAAYHAALDGEEYAARAHSQSMGRMNDKAAA
jgi:hypothetical protein